MTTLNQRIQRVLTTHGYANGTRTWRQTGGSGFCWGVDCDWKGDRSDHPLHVADQIQALLTEEAATFQVAEVRAVGGGTGAAAYGGQLVTTGPYRRRRRWVSDWEGIEQ